MIPDARVRYARHPEPVDPAVELAAKLAGVRARCCGDPAGCVLCEVDGTPIDPVRFAEQQLEQARARERLEAFAAITKTPASAAVGMLIAERLTARQRGELRRQQLEAAVPAERIPFGPVIRGPHLLDRHQTHGRTAGRAGRSDIGSAGSQREAESKLHSAGRRRG